MQCAMDQNAAAFMRIEEAHLPFAQYVTPESASVSRRDFWMLGQKRKGLVTRIMEGQTQIWALVFQPGEMIEKLRLCLLEDDDLCSHRPARIFWLTSDHDDADSGAF